MRKLNIVQQTSEVIRHSFGPTLAFISLMSMATFAPQPVALAQKRSELDHYWQSQHSPF